MVEEVLLAVDGAERGKVSLLSFPGPVDGTMPVHIWAAPIGGY